MNRQFEVTLSRGWHVLAVVEHVLAIGANVVLLTFLVAHRIGGVTSAYFIRGQAIGALVVSAYFAVYIVADPRAPHARVLDTLLCHAYHSGALFVLALATSFYMTVATAVDRYFAVVHPVVYARRLAKARFAGSVIATVIVTSAVFATPHLILPARMHNGTCEVMTAQTNGIDVELANAILAMSIVEVCTVYVLPICLLVALNTATVLTLRRSAVGINRNPLLAETAAKRFTFATVCISAFTAAIAAAGCAYNLPLYWSGHDTERVVSNNVGALLGTSTVLMMGSAASPVIYACIVRGFQSYIVHIVRRAVKCNCCNQDPH